MAFKAGSVYAEAVLDTARWDKGVKHLGKSALKVGKLAAGAFVGAMTVSIAAANEFQKSMSNVSTVIDTSTVSTQDLTKQLITMDPALGKTTELTDALYQSFSAGAEDADEAMETTTAAAKFAGAALTDTATAVDVLTTASNAYGKEVVSTTGASDIFFTTIKEGKITGEQLSASIGKSIPLFASLNIPLEELGSGMAAMTKQGVNASEATTQLNGIVNSFLKPSEDMRAALEEQGFASGSALLETEGLSGALAFLESASGGSKDELSKLLPSVEAVRGTLALTGTGGKEFAKILDEMGNVAGTTDEAFSKQEKTFETFRNSMDKVAIVSGNIGKHFVDDLAGGATDAAGAMLTFITSSSGMELVGNIVGAVAGTFDLLKTAISPLVDLVTDHMIEAFNRGKEELEELGFLAGDGAGAFDILGFVVQSVTSVFRVASVASLEFIGFLGNLVTAVMASGETVGTFFDFLTRKATWDDVKNTAGVAKDAFIGLASGVGDSFSKIAETVVSEVKGFTEEAATRAVEMESSFTLSFDRTKNSVINNWDEMITGQDDFVAEMVANNQDLVNTLDSQNDELENNTKSIFVSIWDSMKQFFADAEFSWAGLYENALAFTAFGLDSISSATSQFYKNESAELDLWISEQLDLIDERHDSEIESLRDAANEKIEINKLFRQEEIDSLTQFSEAELALEEFNRQEKINKLQNSLEINDQLELAAMLAKEEREAQLLATQTEIEAQRQALEEAALVEEKRRKEELAAAEKAKADEIARIEEEALIKRNKLGKEQFENQKALGIASVWVDAATSIAGWWSTAGSLGFPAGPIFAGIMTGATLTMAGIQTGLIASQRFVPARQFGGMASGTTRINEAGGEIVTLPDGSQVVPNDISRQIADSVGTGGHTINVSFAGANIDSKMSLKNIAKEVSKMLGKELRKAG